MSTAFLSSSFLRKILLNSYNVGKIASKKTTKIVKISMHEDFLNTKDADRDLASLSCGVYML